MKGGQEACKHIAPLQSRAFFRWSFRMGTSQWTPQRLLLRAMNFQPSGKGKCCVHRHRIELSIMCSYSPGKAIMGKFRKVYSMLDNPAIYAKLHAYVQSHKWAINPSKLQEFPEENWYLRQQTNTFDTLSKKKCQGG